MEPEMIHEKNNQRWLRLQQKTDMRMAAEFQGQADHLQSRLDYTPKLKPFLDILTRSRNPSIFQQKSQRPFVMTMCNQAPMELFHAAGLGTYKMVCGSFAARDLAPRHLPVLTCPMVKSLAGGLLANNNFEFDRQRLVIPTTCDWVVKFCELNGIDDSCDIHYMELPHLRENERASHRWLEEVHQLKQWLEKTSGKRITRKALHRSVREYAKAFKLFVGLIDLKRRQQVPATHFAVIANALAFGDIERWTTLLIDYLSDISTDEIHKAPVFLAGSPIWFPNYKLLSLIDNASMAVVADDICSLERVFPGPVAYEDASKYGLMNGLAQRNHKACICPTFADNRRRINAILNVIGKWEISGVIYHVLKGCHPYDAEAGILERRLKNKGYRFLKIETDYVDEDEQNIVTRLEAFRRTLGR